MSALPHVVSYESFSDRLFDALQQIHALDEEYLQQIAPGAIAICPAELRDDFAARVAELTRRKPRLISRAGNSRNQSERRFDLILSHVSRRAPAPRDSAVAQLITLAAELATTRDELIERIAQIPPIPGHERESIFWILSGAIASWDVPLDAATDLPPVRAMRKILDFSRDADERAKRFRELVMAAVARLGEGEITAAVSMFELAQTALEEAPPHATVISRIRTDALLALEGGPFARLLGDSSRHPLLRRALVFFPTLARESLLDQLRERRHPERLSLISGLLAVWGESAQSAILKNLDGEVRKHEFDRAYANDLIDLLAKMPRTAGADCDHELDVLGRASSPGQPIDVVEHAIAAIASIKTPAGERLLTRRLAEFEAIPYRTDRAFYPVEELNALLDLIVAAIARLATPSAIRSVVRHCLGHRLGDARARLRFLNNTDLSIEPDSVARLCKTIREELPVLVLGHGVAKNRSHNPAPLIDALRATHDADAKELLGEIAGRYPFLKESVRRGADLTTRENRTGDLRYYTLPALLLSLIESHATGLLSLADDGQEIRGRIWLDNGRIVNLTTGTLTGPAALYQLIERPILGSFAFAHRAVPPHVAIGEIDFARVMREAMQRHDELQLFSAIVPGDVVLTATPLHPSGQSDESDPQLLRAIWVAASSGGSVSSWTESLPADDWRIRRIVARWVEEGSLEPVR